MLPAFAIDDWAKEFSQCPDVFGESMAAVFGDPIDGARLSLYKLLLQPHIPNRPRQALRADAARVLDSRLSEAKPRYGDSLAGHQRRSVD